MNSPNKAAGIHTSLRVPPNGTGSSTYACSGQRPRHYKRMPFGFNGIQTGLPLLHCILSLSRLKGTRALSASVGSHGHCVKVSLRFTILSKTAPVATPQISASTGHKTFRDNEPASQPTSTLSGARAKRQCQLISIQEFQFPSSGQRG